MVRLTNPKSKTAAKSAADETLSHLAQKLPDATLENFKPLSPKEFGKLVGRGRAWVCEQIAEGRLPTLPPHRAPYLLPGNVLFTFTATAKCSKAKSA